MPDLIIPKGTPEIVNLQESRICCFCGNMTKKRKQMWKYSHGQYMCIYCKTRFDEEQARGVTFSSGEEIFK